MSPISELNQEEEDEVLAKDPNLTAADVKTTQHLYLMRSPFCNEKTSKFKP